ncbi:hypothetical protein EB809_18820 [Marinobacter sp. R17]|uniref:TniQ family protein n=1 Tax=Marinobacter sp. R17 TaxID=2484250 RepID=UPI000F4CBA4C|nr:hypothetical protein EB809_18820 [Marinobacter sp. R17]
MLPIHPQPLPDEILSSWMTRLALENQFPLHTFYNKLIQFKGEIWNRDTDRFLQPLLLSQLEKYTGQPQATLQHLSLRYYESILFDHLSEVGNAPWLIPLGIYHRRRRRFGIHYCPVCLAEDRDPYFRRKWRLAFYVACEKHRCLMESGCPRCSAPVTYYRLGMGRSFEIKKYKLSTCASCGYNMGWSKPRQLHSADPQTENILFDLLQTFDRQGWHPPVPSAYSALLFFKGLITLVRLLGRRSVRQRLEPLASEYQLPNQPNRHCEFEISSIEVRSMLLMAALKLIQNWPDRFVEVCQTTGLTNSRITGDLLNEPFWLSQTIRCNLSRPNTALPVEEAKSIHQYLQKHNLPFTKINIQRTLSCSRRYATRIMETLHREQTE